MSEIDLIKADIEITKADLAEAKIKDFPRRDRLEALLTKQTGVWLNLLSIQGEFSANCSFKSHSFNIYDSFDD